MYQNRLGDVLEHNRRYPIFGPITQARYRTEPGTRHARHFIGFVTLYKVYTYAC